MGRNIPADAAQLVGYLLMIPMVYLRTREPDVPDCDDQANLVRFYVKEMSALSRNSLSFWMFVAGVLVLTCGWDLEVARELTGVVILSFLWLLLLALFLAKHVNNRRRFAQIEALLGRPSND
jgi:cell division protein FtsW (lipid II flippase)